MIENRERWAEALQIDRMYGRDAAVWIAERIGALAMAGDVAGVERFRMLAGMIDQLQPGNERGARAA